MPEGSSSSVRRRLAAAALAVYWLALFVGTHWPRELLLEDQKFVVGGDKLLHFAAYAILGGLMFLAVRLHRPTATAAAALSQCAAVAVMAVISGFLDEISQPLTGRDLDWRDLVADAAGAVAGAVAIALWFSRAASPEDT